MQPTSVPQISSNPTAARAGLVQANSLLLLSDNATQPGGPRPLLQGLTERELDLLMAKGRRRVLYRGATLFSQDTPNDGIYLIETGRMRVFYTAPSGREITLAYWYPGNFVGGPEVFGTGLHSWSGIATSNSSVLHLPGKALRQLVTQIPTLAIGVIEGLSFKGRCYSALAQMLGTRSITERLAHLLLHLADLYGVPEENDTVIAATFTHADLAHMVGATRQWVTISLKRLSEQKIIHTRRSQIVILRPDVLAQMRGGEHSA
ncbi:Crp/Fnr family transcriptional regulator [Methylobacterium sp. Leaf125]|uniref:Crp/Fnr family transcriptional regulator n=1 Tax=Methylobacterium sp. Leaf125 TaxID=1736265 RepID=UPI0006F65E92|nr:Crp/Fnr family transcriptional regulator [Methylobacterium sp. Leaf125]KQQ45002.1 Crp/Fnr family transcriptional regulator [Methylobacterium sp. Leaf125]